LTVLPPIFRLLPEIAKLPLLVAPEHDPVVARANVDPAQLPGEQVAVRVSIVVPDVAGVVKAVPFDRVTPVIVGVTLPPPLVGIKRLGLAGNAIIDSKPAARRRRFITGKTPVSAATRH
jgi:hypothetical protein